MPWRFAFSGDHSPWCPPSPWPQSGSDASRAAVPRHISPTSQDRENNSKLSRSSVVANREAAPSSALAWSAPWWSGYMPPKSPACALPTQPDHCPHATTRRATACPGRGRMAPFREGGGQLTHVQASISDQCPVGPHHHPQRKLYAHSGQRPGGCRKTAPGTFRGPSSLMATERLEGKLT